MIRTRLWTGIVAILLVTPLTLLRMQAATPRHVAAEDLLDLNRATAAQLAALPGMGVVYARRVVDGRPYLAKNQLVTRGVLPREAYERIKGRIVAHRPGQN